MNKHKVFIALLFTLVLGSMLTACSEESSKEDEPTEEEKKTITIYENGATVQYAEELKPGEDDQYIDELKRLSGFDIEYNIVPQSEYLDKLPILFASGDLPDLIRTGGITDPAHKGALESGALMELGLLLEEHGSHILENISDDIWKSPLVSKDGEIYGIPGFISTPADRITYIRKDWLDKLDMDVPETLDDWLAYFEAVKNEDMNDNGDSDDEYGYHMRESQGYNTLFFGAFGVHPNTWREQDGKVIPDMITSDMKDAIAFYRDLYDNGYINPNLFTRTASDWEADIYKGIAGSWTHDINNYAGKWGKKENYDNPDNTDIIMVPPPIGPNGDQGLSVEGSGIAYVYVIPSDTEDPEEVIKYLDWAWSSEEADQFFTLGIEDYNYTVDDDGEITWDASSPENAEKNALFVYTVVLNVTGDARMSSLALEHTENGDLIEEAKQISEDTIISNETVHMPRLDAYSASPEITPGLGDGTLFLEMFAKVITGREELDPAFENFVEEWKKRGGDEVLEEANEWYNDFNE